MIKINLKKIFQNNVHSYVMNKLRKVFINFLIGYLPSSIKNFKFIEVF